jgi:hypothetical protein
VSSRPSSIPGPPARETAPDGFSAQLRGASLFDLIQFEATARGRKVVRVASEGRSALLYFSDGRIVHAAAGKLTGEVAVREMLTWGKGTFARFDHFEGAWPAFETIGGSTESVLLRAAQLLDEGANNLVPLPVRAPAAEVRAVPPKLPRPTTLPLSGPLDLAMRLSADGDLLERQGGGRDEEGFCDVVAYAAQLTDLIGELLGLARFEHAELTFREGKLVVARQADQTLLAARAGASGTFEALRLRVGLG